MNELTIIHHDGIEVVDSREVAKMIDKRHDNLMRDIAGYITAIEKSNALKIEVVDFFIPSTYADPKGENRPHYLLTKKGCDMVANKMTGEKGVLFTAAYVTAFEAMREHIQKGKQLVSTQPEYTGLSPEIQMLKLLIDKAANAELEQKRQAAALTTVEQKVDGIREIVAINPQSWRDECGKLLRTIATQIGGGSAYKEVNAEAYHLVDERAGVSLATRLTNKRRRMADEGVCKSKRDRLNQLDVIQDDKKLIEIFIAVVKELALKYGVDLPAAETINPGA